MHALAGVPRLETPEGVTPTNPHRVFQLRALPPGPLPPVHTQREVESERERAC
jgi:hypothetical protein